MGVKAVLQWSFAPDVTKPADGFRLKRRITGQAWPVAPLAEIPFIAGQSAYSYQDLTVVYGTSYIYGLSSYGQGGESTPMLELTLLATVPAPPSPTGFTGEVQGT